VVDDDIREDDDDLLLEDDDQEGGPGGRSYGGRARGGGRAGVGRRYGRARVCSFCSDKVKKIDYKDYDLLRRYINNRGRIAPRRQTGTCAKHQRALAVAIKRARHVALLPFTAEHTYD
jgi:small subunit ribosomal protein S18